MVGSFLGMEQPGQVFAEALIASSKPGCFNPEDIFNLGELAAPLNGIGVRIAQPSH
jgi:hypothetical protein